jgi:hypothetical protein
VNLYYDYLKSLVMNETSNDYKSWIDESIKYVCEQIYLDDNNIKLNVSLNFTLGENYFNRNWPIVDQRLSQGGHRLAILLNRLVEHRSSLKLSPHIQALIVVLCIEFVIGILAGIFFFVFRKHYIGRNNDVLISSEQLD